LGTVSLERAEEVVASKHPGLQEFQKPFFTEVSLLQNSLQQRRLNVCSVVNRNSHSQLGSRSMEEPGVTAFLVMNVEPRALKRLEQSSRFDWY
jgi:hypothetical protein